MKKTFKVGFTPEGKIKVYAVDAEDRTFSPAWNRARYIKIMLGYSDEFCHNIYRLIMRPNSSSAQYWFKEACTWLSDAMRANIGVKTKPIWNLFGAVLDENIESFPMDANSSFMYHKVRAEKMYGPIVNDNLSYIESKVKDLYESFDPKKIYNFDEVWEIYVNWYKSINGAKKVFKIG